MSTSRNAIFKLGKLYFHVLLFKYICQGTKLWIIMEYLGGGSALDLVRKQAILDILQRFLCVPFDFCFIICLISPL